MMLSPERKKNLLKEAEELAGALAGGLVTRTEWSHVPNALYLGADLSRRDPRHAEELIEALPSSWAGKRSNKTRDQLNQVRHTFRGIRRKKLNAEELRYVLGWVSRLLRIRQRKR